MKNSIPDHNLELTHVYGFTNEAVRNNIKYNHKGQLVYTQAAVAIVLDVNKQEQSFYHGHSDQILCLDVHGRKAITG